MINQRRACSSPKCLDWSTSHKLIGYEWTCLECGQKNGIDHDEFMKTVGVSVGEYTSSPVELRTDRTAEVAALKSEVERLREAVRLYHASIDAIGVCMCLLCSPRAALRGEENPK